MTKDCWIVVGPGGNSYHDTEASAIAAFKDDPSAVRVVKQTLRTVKTRLAEDIISGPSEHWTNRGSETHLIVERIGNREKWVTA